MRAPTSRPPLPLHPQRGAPFARLPFNCCAINFTPFEDPVCTDDGIVYDIVAVVPYVRKFGRHPVKGTPLQHGDLLPLNCHKNTGARPRQAGSLVSAPVFDALWQEAKMQQAQLRARAQKRLDIEARMKEERAREIQALREQAQEEEEKRRQKEEDAKREAERIKQEARDKARLEREQLEQTIDMDAQGAVMDAEGDEDEDDLGGF